ncbi:nucleoside triphosphate pyrophosphohydrolase family protein [Candidatus Saccharibacteria bacterium]|nr:nucleoside triphosphate pyrophosphohydrolase family protein [Candidatus Saccharibacteria bacterium]
MNEYQDSAKQYDLFKATGNYNTVAFVEKILGLAGEAGETADKIKKILRDKDGIICEEDKIEIVKELGDVLWYIASISRYLGVPLEEVARTNLEKLEGRRKNNLLHGEGDNR